MDNERLQEIKDDIADWFDLDEERHAVLDELITAHENQGELLRLSLGNVDKLNTALEACQQQLAEAQAKLARSELTLDYVREEWKNDTAVADLRKQLAEAREIELRYLGQVGSLEKQLVASQAEVKRLRFLLEEYRRVNETLVDTVS